ncbi:MAG TPA: hypothetical protein VIV12_18610 [Streptosporangiaceae bacterium]
MPPTQADDVQLRHGYTVAQVSSLSLALVKRQTWLESVSFDQRLEVAWHAIIEHIYTSEQPPGHREVMLAADRAVNRDVQLTRQFHGRNTHHRYAGTTIKGFERYWWFAAKPIPGPENRVTDRVALAQIWPRLHPAHQTVLAALANHNDHGLAAASLGISRRLFTSRLSDARQAFLKLWHEGESPSRLWRGNKTTTPRRRRARGAAGNGQPARRRSTPGRARADLGISDAELVRRYQAGESVRQLAASLGTYYSAVHTRLHAEGAQLRRVGQPPGPRLR